MGNIDTSAIEGFDTMTADEKVEALLKLEVPEKVDLSAYVKKDMFDKTSSELAAAKKSLKEKMTADEAAKAQADEEKSKLQEAYNELMKKHTIAEHTAKYLAIGYSEDLAKSTAEAIFDGDTDRILENQKKYNAECEKRYKEQLERRLHPNGSQGNKSFESEIAEKLGKRAAEAEEKARKTFEHYVKF